jgi:four helix bundle protein
MKPTFSFENILAWQKAHSLTILVYQITRNFPEDEKFGLTSQFRRAAVSVEANIAEGYKKISKADKLRFLNISEGSLAECRNYIILSRDLYFINEEEYTSLYLALEESSRLLTAYSKGIINNNGIKD